VQVPVENLIGEENQGFKYIMSVIAILVDARTEPFIWACCFRRLLIFSFAVRAVLLLGTTSTTSVGVYACRRFVSPVCAWRKPCAIRSSARRSVRR
jgi:hypothetical protein